MAMKLLAFFLLVAQVSAQCSLCPGGSSQITDNDAALVEDSDLVKTCGEREADAQDIPASQCDSFVNNQDLDYSAFCCADVEPSGSCPFCEGLEVDVDLPLPSEASLFVATCGGVEELAKYIKGEQTCNTVVNVGTTNCCLTPSASPSRAPTTPQPAPPTPPPTQGSLSPTPAPQADATPAPQQPTGPTQAPISTNSAANAVSLAIMTIMVWFSPTVVPGDNVVLHRPAITLQKGSNF
eukprot:scaffold23479_cov143-Cylindrotheca_fusiformis.AAC.1